jgi:hypothetical protein
MHVLSLYRTPYQQKRRTLGPDITQKKKEKRPLSKLGTLGPDITQKKKKKKDLCSCCKCEEQAKRKNIQERKR